MEDLDIHYTYVIRMKVSKKLKGKNRDIETWLRLVHLVHDNDLLEINEANSTVLEQGLFSPCKFSRLQNTIQR